MGDEYETITAAAVQASSVFLNREQSVEKACELIAEAGTNGADVVVFPEGFVPAHPIWFKFRPAFADEVSSRLSVELFKNAVEVPGPATRILGEAAERAGVYLVMGVCEKVPDTTGTMYNTQLFFSPDGELLGKHQKLTPTTGEQLVHAAGKRENFGAVETEFGPMSGLICGENSNPLATFALAAEHTRIHAMSWPPYTSNPSGPDRNVYVSRAFAQTTKAFVISAAGTIDERAIETMELDGALAENVTPSACSGGSVIVSPSRRVLAGPLENEEGILYAELPLEETIAGKLIHDFSGHYNRPDLFQLHVNRGPDEILLETDDSTDRPTETSPEEVPSPSERQGARPGEASSRHTGSETDEREDRRRDRRPRE